MPDFILLLHSPAGPRPAFSPEQISAVTQDYMGWRNRMRAEGHLKGGEKLTFDAGRVMRANGGRVTVTDGASQCVESGGVPDDMNFAGEVLEVLR